MNVNAVVLASFEIHSPAPDKQIETSFSRAKVDAPTEGLSRSTQQNNLAISQIKS
jgi:hypothetical protein